MSKLDNLQFTTGSTVEQIDETGKIFHCLLLLFVYLVLKPFYGSLDSFCLFPYIKHPYACMKLSIGVNRGRLSFTPSISRKK